MRGTTTVISTVASKRFQQGVNCLLLAHHINNQQRRRWDEFVLSAITSYREVLSAENSG
jgi:hypothetical protein